MQDLSLAVPAGQSLALWGPNGAGKSTTFHAMLGLVPYQGTIRIFGEDARSVKARRMVGWAPQDLAPPDMTVGRAVRFLAELREAPVASVGAFLEPFGLAAETALPVAALSGGQRKRLSLALALLGDPQVLLLDEPTANLDPAGRTQMLDLLSGLRARGKTLFLASHRLGDVRRLCDQVALLCDGVVNRVCAAGRFGALQRRFLAPRSFMGLGTAVDWPERRCGSVASASESGLFGTRTRAVAGACSGGGEGEGKGEGKGGSSCGDG
ncbi:MAG TPA: ABC transporter ATP-binding protein [Symbiobacteriaceae bacterium]